MEMSGLVKDRLMPTAAEVAAYGYRAMRRGKTVAVPGLLNRLRAHAVRFAPRRLVARIARQVIARAPR
jgi:short-subunit dehydrogenase